MPNNPNICFFIRVLLFFHWKGAIMKSHINYRNWVLRNFFSREERRQIFTALDFAQEKHSGQKRRSTGEPYIRHPEMVSIAIYKLGLPLSYVIAALLHDITEDCAITRMEISSVFGKEIGNLVHFMDRKNLEHFRKERPDFLSYEEKKDYFLQNVDSKAILLRLADGWNNLWEYQGYKNGEKTEIAAKNILELIQSAEEILPKSQIHSNFLSEIEKLAKRVKELAKK